MHFGDYIINYKDFKKVAYTVLAADMSQAGSHSYAVEFVDLCLTLCVVCSVKTLSCEL